MIRRTPTPPGAASNFGAFPRTAVFIDGDWFNHATRSLGLAIDYEHLAGAFRATFGAGVYLVSSQVSMTAAVDKKHLSIQLPPPAL